MSTPNPLMPQGSIPQPGAKGKSNLRLVVFGVVAVHAVFLVGLLMQGCKPDSSKDTKKETAKQELAPITETLPVTTTDPNMGAPTSSAPVTSVVPTTPTTAAPVTRVDPLGPAPGSVVATPGAAMPVTSPEAAPGATAEYVVMKGDSFSSIAKKLRVPVKAIQDANPNVNPNRMQIGQKLQVPEASAPAAPGVTASAAEADGSAVYTVKAGDTLSKIARSHATTVQAIRTANNLKTDRINAGQKLKVPSARTATTSAPVETPVAAPGAATAPTTSAVPATAPAPRTIP